ncbi:MAG: right-handed parallel beta-helix repeat-containing protein [Patescibacteria group bacterium]
MLRKFSVLVLVVTLFFSPVPLPSHFSFAADGFEEILGYTEWSGEKIIDGTVYIDPLATLVIKKGTVITFRNWSVMDIQGKLRIEGTVKEPVILQKDSSLPETIYSLQISNQGEVMIRNADISGGGSVAYQVQNKRQNIFFNTASAGSYTGVIQWQGGKSFVAENVSFHDNTAAVYIENQSPAAKIQVHRSRFLNNEYDVLNARTGSVDFRYNWWGDASGPQKRCATCSTYEKISGRVDVADWAKQADTKDPVIVVPGILGSQQWYDGSGLVLDPIFGIYEGLLENLEENGYEKGKNLFSFPYNWGQSNSVSATELQEKINQIKNQARWPKVDIVAHSMGGLVARQYIESVSYQEDIDQLITLGTPHNGAPKSYLAWEGGDFGHDFFDVILKWIISQGAEENNFDNVFEYIRNFPVISLTELLPTYSYLRDKGTNVMRIYPDLHPKNVFIENLNKIENLQKLRNVEFTNVAGRITSDKTITTLRIGSPANDSENDLWGYGKPDGYDDLIGDKGLETGAGDGTVPLESAKGIPSDQEIEINSSHLDLPSKAADTVYTVLSGLDSIADVSPLIINSILFVPVFSPIDIQIISPSNKKMGKNFETGGIYDEIPGAYYTGYDMQNEFITVPNPEDGEYRILTQGTGEGSYRIEAIKITEGVNPDDAAKESVATLTGTATISATEEKKIELLADDTVISKEDRDIIAPTISITSPENKSYLNNQVLPITYAATDNITAEANIQKILTLDGNAFSQTTIDLSLQTLGNHMLSVQATDEAGNVAHQSVSFENTVTFGSLRNNLDHYLSLGLIKKKEDVKYIQAHLRYFEKLQEIIDHLDQIRYFPPKAKERLLEHFQKELDHMQEEFIEYLLKRTVKGAIAPLAKDRIVEAVERLVQ